LAAATNFADDRKLDKFMRPALILALHRVSHGRDSTPTKRLYRATDATLNVAVEGDIIVICDIFDRAEDNAVKIQRLTDPNCVAVRIDEVHDLREPIAQYLTDLVLRGGKGRPPIWSADAPGAMVTQVIPGTAAGRLNRSKLREGRG
jgi:hypothetical protein